MKVRPVVVSSDTVGQSSDPDNAAPSDIMVFRPDGQFFTFTSFEAGHFWLAPTNLTLTSMLWDGSVGPTATVMVTQPWWMTPFFLFDLSSTFAGAVLSKLVINWDNEIYSSYIDDVNVSIASASSPVPLPGAAWLFFTGLGGFTTLHQMARRRKELTS